MNRRFALKSMLAGLAYALTPMAFAKSKTFSRELREHWLYIDGGSLRDSYFRFHRAASRQRSCSGSSRRK